jgi:hypothetical protein
VVYIGAAFCNNILDNAPTALVLSAWGSDASSGQFQFTAYYDRCGSNFQYPPTTGGQVTNSQDNTQVVSATFGRIASSGCLQSNVDVNLGYGVPQVITRFGKRFTLSNTHLLNEFLWDFNHARFC